eukprot:GHUV01049801.1.p1 GENE.GHUV01049801.1~~GHUV01049801.1.p1  ORF type:complete len:172 (+),score=38.07 GHUV01049801.1:88-603(+)
MRWEGGALCSVQPEVIMLIQGSYVGAGVHECLRRKAAGLCKETDSYHPRCSSGFPVCALQMLSSTDQLLEQGSEASGGHVLCQGHSRGLHALQLIMCHDLAYTWLTPLLAQVLEKLDEEGCACVAQVLKKLPCSSVFVVGQANSFVTKEFAAVDTVVKSGGCATVELGVRQ